MLQFIFIFLIGMVSGWCARAHVNKTMRDTDGVLHVDISNEDGPYLFLELTKGLPEVTHKNVVEFDVKLAKFSTQD